MITQVNRKECPMFSKRSKDYGVSEAILNLLEVWHNQLPGDGSIRFLLQGAVVSNCFPVHSHTEKNVNGCASIFWKSNSCYPKQGGWRGPFLGWILGCGQLVTRSQGRCANRSSAIARRTRRIPPCGVHSIHSFLFHSLQQKLIQSVSSRNRLRPENAWWKQGTNTNSELRE